MFHNHSIAVIIPALNEAASLPSVLSAIPPWVDQVVVADNGSTDGTDAIATRMGATLAREPARGYGAACLAGLRAMSDAADIVVFLDADRSDFPEQMDRLVRPICDGRADLVIGSRTLGRREPGSLTVPQRFGNALSCDLIRRIWRHRYSDLGPFRAIRTGALAALRMDDRTYGWTIQMQIRALRAGLRVMEAPVDYRRRIGQSKISGTVSGVLRAGVKILATIGGEYRHPKPLVSIAPKPDHVIVFTRYPAPGEAKTRMIPALGAEGAATLQREMTLHTLAIVDRVASRPGVSMEVRFAGGDAARMSEAFGPNRVYRRQAGSDLGARLHGASAEASARGARRVVLLGSDCPGLMPALLDRSFSALRQSDVVLGPARDGGYYLIGLQRPRPALFCGIEWGTRRVLAQTLVGAKQAGLTVHLLPELRDVDTPDDLPHWSHHRDRYLVQGRIPRISVIIPTLNEQGQVAQAIESARMAPDVEVVVVDSGEDETHAIADSMGAIVLHSEVGRARQMNVGARAARGEILLFLHADTVLPPRYAEHVSHALDDPRVALTAFRLSVSPSGLGLRAIARLANLRSRWLGMPYGDQAFAMRADVFRQIGGFQELPVMEDFEFVRRILRLGKVRVLPQSVCTSARGWLSAGLWLTTLINQVCIAGFLLKISADRLMRLRQYALVARAGTGISGTARAAAQPLCSEDRIQEPLP